MISFNTKLVAYRLALTLMLKDLFQENCMYNIYIYILKHHNTKDNEAFSLCIINLNVLHRILTVKIFRTKTFLFS